MTTTIDNNQRKFLVQSQGLGNTKDIFCNLADIPNVIKTAFEKNEEFKIYEFWNRKLKTIICINQPIDHWISQCHRYFLILTKRICYQEKEKYCN